MNFGIESENYTLEDGKVKAIENSGYFYNSANREAEVTPVLGYTFDPEPVTAEIAAMAAIKKKFDKWQYEDDYEQRYDQYVEKAREPAQTIQAESQKQLDAWWAANKK